MTQRLDTLIEDRQAILRRMFVFIVPMLLTSAMTSFGPMLSLIWVGRLVSTQSLGALITVSIIGATLSAVLTALVTGGAVLMGQAVGANKETTVLRVAGTVFASAFCAGVGVSLVGLYGSGFILSIIGTPKQIVPDTEAYARLLFGLSPVTFLFYAYVGLLRGTGDSKTPLFGTILAAIVCGTLPPFLILGWFGIPHFGVLSVAISVIVGQMVALCAMLIILRFKKNPLRPTRQLFRSIGIDLGLLKNVLSIGVPMSLQFLLVIVSEAILLAFVNQFGSNATAAWGTVLQIMTISQWPSMALGSAVSVMGAQCIGARRPEVMADVVRSGLTLNYAVGGAFVILCYLLSAQLIGWSITDARTFDVAKGLLMPMLWSSVIYGNTLVISAIMRATGVVLWPTIITVSTIWLIELPLVFALTRFGGLWGVVIGYPSAFCCGLVLMLSYYELAWKRRPHESLV